MEYDEDTGIINVEEFENFSKEQLVRAREKFLELKPFSTESDGSTHTEVIDDKVLNKVDDDIKAPFEIYMELIESKAALENNIKSSQEFIQQMEDVIKTVDARLLIFDKPDLLK